MAREWRFVNPALARAPAARLRSRHCTQRAPQPVNTGIRDTLPTLPISPLLGEIARSLRARPELVLEAPPGAGKTTLVPLALLEEPWLAGQKILMLEPRRMAARAAAERMASLLGEEAGFTVGYRVRLEAKVSARTRIEVITEGILNRMLQDDPSLAGTGLLIFDEFHERSLDADLGLALALAGRALFRESADPLRILVMSATLDGAAVARVLGDAPVLRAEGRSFPVGVHYATSTPQRDELMPALRRTLQGLLQQAPEDTGDILVFLPGQAEIERLSALLTPPEGTVLLPLHGQLSLAEQQRAIAPAPPLTRRVVLSTNIAETSLTIEGVATVVDAGLAREPQYDPATGLTQLRTRRLSRASAEQRAGRAGRLRPGNCHRLWTESEHRALAAARSPEIRQADLAPMALSLIAWGVSDPAELAWLDAPPAGAWNEALALLQEAGAITPGTGGTWSLSEFGTRMAAMPMHPRLARMLLGATDRAEAEAACALAALLAERAPGGRVGADLTPLVEILLERTPCPPSHRGWAQRARRQASLYRRDTGAVRAAHGASEDLAHLSGRLLALAYPDRIARRRPGAHALYQLANGRSARLDEADPLATREWLVAAELGSRAGDASERIFLAAELDPASFSRELAFLVHEEESAEWSSAEGRFVAERRRRVGALLLSREPLRDIDPAQRGKAICDWLARSGMNALPWTEDLRQWRARVMLLHTLEPDTWPDLSDAQLLATLPEWLGPLLERVNTQTDLQRMDMAGALAGLLPWPLPRELDRLAPQRIDVPSGSSVEVDYTQSPPVLAVKLQEMFGCAGTPRVANGRVPLLIHLLSPARRPLQVTQDLAAFWRNAYAEVRKEMRGRYPRHPWPEDPLAAAPTRHTKRRQALEQGGN